MGIPRGRGKLFSRTAMWREPEPVFLPTEAEHAKLVEKARILRQGQQSGLSLEQYLDSQNTVCPAS